MTDLPPGADEEAPVRRFSWPYLRDHNVWSKVVGAVVATAIVAGATGLVTPRRDDPRAKAATAVLSDNDCNVTNSVNTGTISCSDEAPKTPAKLSATLDVRNGATQAEQRSGSGLSYIDETQPIINVTVRNDGGTGVAIDKTRVVVEYVADIEPCQPSGGERIETWTQGITLPADLAAGQAFNSADSSAYSIESDDAGRFGLKLRPDEGWDAALARKLVRLRVELRTVSDGQWWQAGKAALSLPGTRQNEFVRIAGESMYPVDGGSPESRDFGECLERNRSLLDESASTAGTALSDELAAVR